MKKIFKEENFDAVLGTDINLNVYIAMIKTNAKKIGCEHMNYDAIKSARYLINRKFWYPRLNAVVCLTNADAKNYSFVKRENLFVIPNSLSFECENPSSCQEKRIIAVGRLSEEKGFDMLVEMAPKIKSEVPDWKIDIFGEGEESDALLKKIEDLNLLDFVKIHAPTKNIREELTRSSIYVLPSRHEGLPMVLLEAQTCGIPAVAFDCHYGPGEIVIEGETGFVVPCFDTNEFAKKVVLLAKDAEKRALFGKAAAKMSARYSTKKVSELWLKMLSKI